ncbi:MAG: hypothetical protein AAF587_36735 [Bacteroidota bacterium]
MTRLTPKRLLLILLLPLILFGCKEVRDSDVKGLELTLDFLRLDSLMYVAAQDIQTNQRSHFDAYQTHLSSEANFFYEFMGLDQFPASRSLRPPELDSLLATELGRILAEPSMLKLLDTVRQVFPYEESIVDLIQAPLIRLERDFSDIQLPAFRTHVSGYVPGGDYRTADYAVPTPGFFSIGLHYFLGESYPYYPPNIPSYMRKRFQPEALPVMMMHEIAEGMVSPLDKSKQPTLLDGMVRAGIKQYFLQEMLPYTPDSVRLFYSYPQMYWAEVYEKRIYKHLIPNLFDIDFKFHRDFLSDKPYTTDLSTESAPRIGEYMGWKIVSSYMDRHPEVSLESLCNRTDYETIFRESRYKPQGGE